MRKKTAILIKMISFAAIIGIIALLVKQRIDLVSDLESWYDRTGQEYYLVQSKIFTVDIDLCAVLFGLCISLANYAVNIFFKYDKRVRKKNLTLLFGIAAFALSFILVMFITKESPVIYEYMYLFIFLYIIITGVLSGHFIPKINSEKPLTPVGGESKKDGFVPIGPEASVDIDSETKPTIDNNPEIEKV
jgi:amino acid transporter